MPLERNPDLIQRAKPSRRKPQTLRQKSKGYDEVKGQVACGKPRQWEIVSTVYIGNSNINL